MKKLLQSRKKWQKIK